MTSYLNRSQVFIAVAGTAVLLVGIGTVWSYGFNSQILPCFWQTGHTLWGVGLGFVVAGISRWFYQFVPAYRQAADEYLGMVLVPLQPIDLLWLGVLPGISEEFLFRGVILPSLGMGGGALVVSSLVFGALHMSSWKHLPYTLWAAIVGLLFGALTIVTHNLLPVIIAHALTNSLSGWFWQRSQTAS